MLSQQLAEMKRFVYLMLFQLILISCNELYIYIYIYNLLFIYLRWSVCGTAEVVWKPRFLWWRPSAHLHFLVSCFSSSSWQYSIDSLWGSGLVSLLASQAHQHHGHLTNFWCFGSVGRCQILLENEISIFKSWSAEGSMKCSKISW